jgi:hypothetical protein
MTCHEDDPLLVHFVTPQEAASIEGLSYLSMDRPDRATAAFRQATDNPDPARHRNLAYYTVWSAVGHAREHDLISASEVGRAAIPLVADLTPGRTTRLLGQLRAHVEPHRRGAPKVQDFVHAYDEAQAQ